MMMTPIFGEIIILVLLMLCCSRFFFIKRTRIDSFALFAPLSFILLILQIVSWGLNVSEFFILIITIIVLITNYRSVLRFFNHLYVDFYRLPFIIASSISLVLIVALIVVLLLNIPRPLVPEKFQTKVEIQYFSQQEDGNFVQSDKIFSNRNLKLSIYSPSEENKSADKNTVFLFVPDKKASSLAYEPYLVLLAKYGYTIYAGNFGFSTVQGAPKYVPQEFLRFELLRKTVFEKPDQEFFDEHPEYYDAYSKEFEILSQIANEQESKVKNFAIIGDNSSARCFDKIKNPARTIDFAFALNSVPEYKTSGYGFIESIDPIFAKIRFEIKKDKTYFIPSYVAMKTKNALEVANDIK